MTRALITGIGGQDGYYLAHFLNRQGYELFGLLNDPNPDDHPLREVLPFVRLLSGDLTDHASLVNVCEVAEPDEVYNFGAQSSVDGSYREQDLTAHVTGVGALHLLQAVYSRPRAESVRFYQASSSEMFGKASESPQTDRTSFNPQSPYGAAKVFAHQMTSIYREAYGIFACAGIAFNHESPRRKPNFVTRKVTRSAARIKYGLQSHLGLGNLDSRRDWGFAGDYVDAMWRIIQAPNPAEYVLATGVSHSVGELVEIAFGLIGISNWQDYVKLDERHRRPRCARTRGRCVQGSRGAGLEGDDDVRRSDRAHAGCGSAVGRRGGKGLVSAAAGTEGSASVPSPGGPMRVDVWRSLLTEQWVQCGNDIRQNDALLWQIPASIGAIVALLLNALRDGIDAGEPSLLHLTAVVVAVLVTASLVITEFKNRVFQVSRNIYRKSIFRALLDVSSLPDDAVVVPSLTLRDYHREELPGFVEAKTRDIEDHVLAAAWKAAGSRVLGARVASVSAYMTLFYLSLVVLAGEVGLLGWMVGKTVW